MLMMLKWGDSELHLVIWGESCSSTSVVAFIDRCLSTALPRGFATNILTAPRNHHDVFLSEVIYQTAVVVLDLFFSITK